MKLRAVALLITVAYLVLYVGHAWHLKRTVYGDGVFYYAWLRSIVVDRDIDFRNEYRVMGVTQPGTPTGAVGNKYSIGPALLWSPAYMTLHSVIRGTGWNLPYQVTVGFVSVFSAIAGLLLLTRILPPPQGAIPITVLAIAGATNLLFYGSIDPVNSHALSFFMAVVYLVLLTAAKKHWFAIGVALALLCSIRLQDGIYILAMVPLYTRIRWKQFLAGFAIAFLPQLAAWYLLYGSLTNPYLAGGETFDLSHPHILGVLFGSGSGLFLWTPIVAVGVYGLIRQWKTYWPYLLVFIAQVYLVASWSTWWQGASVSGRMFVSTLPVIALGIHAVVRALHAKVLLRSTLPLLVLGLAMINAISIFYYLFTF